METTSDGSPVIDTRTESATRNQHDLYRLLPGVERDVC